MAVTLTEAASRHVQKYIDRRGKGIGLRLGVKTSGCSGMATSWSLPTQSMMTITSTKASA